MSWLDDARQRPTQRPYGLAPLAAVLGLEVGDTDSLALALGLNRSSVKRYRELGLTSAQADVWAERAGLDAAVVWPGPEWVLWGAARVNALKRECPAGHPLDWVDAYGRRRCSTCRRAQWRRRWEEGKSLVGAVVEGRSNHHAPLVCLDGGVPDDQPKREPLIAHAPPELRQRVDDLARAAGLSRSAWLCMTISAAVAGTQRDEGHREFRVDAEAAAS